MFPQVPPHLSPTSDAALPHVCWNNSMESFYKKNIWDGSTFPPQRRIEPEPSHMGRWSCYWRLPRLGMRIKDRSRLSARKGWKGAKSQCVQIPGSITQPKTASLHSCAMVSLAFLPVEQALTPRDQVNPDEAWWGSRAAPQLHHMGWVSAGTQPHLMETHAVMQYVTTCHEEQLHFRWRATSHESNKMRSPFPPTKERSLSTRPSMTSKQNDAQMPKSWNKVQLFWSNWFLA